MVAKVSVVLLESSSSIAKVSLLVYDTEIVIVIHFVQEQL